MGRRQKKIEHLIKFAVDLIIKIMLATAALITAIAQLIDALN